MPDSTSGLDSASMDAAATAGETLQADVSLSEVDSKASVEISGGDSAAPSDSVAETVIEVAGSDASGAEVDVPSTSADAAVVDSADAQTAVFTIG
ncbi:MAG: hypothetical protein EXR77_06655 [Myxococcales bacterium]|nr:hypothetical protein [Myxococcales bacterium]